MQKVIKKYDSLENCGTIYFLKQNGKYEEIKMTTIKLDIEFSSLGETTEAVAKVFAAEIQQRIESEYPDASVSVGIDIRGFGGLSVDADSVDEQDSIIECVNYIERDVWENGAWHNAS
ncbi:hypothetical protein IQ508_000769 [Salmonella enterica]|nr:hypothetical protein [Salmonella enterica]EGL4564783.1 hypothetical protein [Salmonella enterica]EGL4582804.1 hypothetical protein [Salmonella enterica]EGL4632029.1 hypothetical protein [Salmonella enterica]EGL4649923.1 hypothetical protein [Salmonella enterica]